MMTTYSFGVILIALAVTVASVLNSMNNMAKGK